MRESLVKWSWRVTATVWWLWGLARLIGPSYGPQWIVGLPLTYVAAVSGVTLVLTVIFKRLKFLGCFGRVFGFPLYVLFWPITILGLVSRQIWRALRAGVQNVQRPIWSLIPYLSTGAAILILVVWPAPGIASVVIALALLSLLLIGVSLIVWIFRPLAWASNTLAWFISLGLREGSQPRIPSRRELVHASEEVRSQLESGITTLRTWHNVLTKLQIPGPAYQDTMLILGFARKFFVSILHTGFLFGLIHFTLNRFSQPEHPQYQGLPVGDFSSHWFVYFYYGMMNLLTGETGALPLSTGASIFTLFNSLTGMLFLVLLVTTFSMLTRERARQGVERISRLVQG